jgi:hypothetical protein
MAVSYQVPADGLELSQFLDKPGTFHVLVLEVDENPVNNNGEVMNAIRLRGRVLAGTEPTQIGRTVSSLMSNPNMSHKDGGAFATKVHLRLARAVGAISQAAPGQAVSVDWTLAKGKQCVVQFGWNKGSDGVERVEVKGGGIYHVGDPEVASIPKDMAALAMMGGGGQSQQATSRPAAANAQAATQQQAAAAPASATAWGDI